MSQYYVNKQTQANGDHEVHERDCSWFPAAEHALYLGEFSHCTYAVTEAKKYYPQANGCYYCSNACHTQ